MKLHRCLLKSLLGATLVTAAQFAFAETCEPSQVQAGTEVFQTKCTACHSVEKSAGQMMGPNLHGLMGRKAGSLPGFNYSVAMKSKDITWNSSTFEQFITKPQMYVSGTYMPFAGLKSESDRHNLDCYLSSQK